MTPQIDENAKPTIPLEIIEDHPLPVWYDDADRRQGNGVVSAAYATEMGAVCGEYSWEGCVENPIYIASYRRFVARRMRDEVWTHLLLWRRPDTGEVVTKQARARWISDHEVIGEIVPFISTDLPWRTIWLKRFMIFAVGFMVGSLLPIWLNL